jgi:hypothetical protein
MNFISLLQVFAFIDESYLARLSEDIISQIKGLYYKTEKFYNTGPRSNGQPPKSQVTKMSTCQKSTCT